LLLVAFLLVNAPNCHLYLVLASVVQGDAVNCNTMPMQATPKWHPLLQKFCACFRWRTFVNKCFLLWTSIKQSCA